MGSYYKLGIGKGIGTEPQASLESQEYENRVNEIENNKNKAIDFVNINESNFPYNENLSKYEK